MPFRTRRKSDRIARRAVVLLCCLCGAAAGAGYVNDFSKSEVGKVPAEFQVAAGAFAVAEFDGNRVLELAGEPLDTFGLLYGPAQPAEATASARVQGDSTGRRFPELGVGVGDIGGYRLMLLPGQKKLQLRKGEDPLAAADLAQPWTSGSWTVLKLTVRKLDGGKWKVEGKAWPAGQPEPAAPTVTLDTNEAPAAGRASIWGVPFSGKPIRFDDLSAGRLSSPVAPGRAVPPAASPTSPAPPPRTASPARRRSRLCPLAASSGSSR